MYEIFSSENLLEALLYALISPALLVLLGLLIHYIDLFITNALAGITNRTAAFVFRNYLTYPGTVHHELFRDMSDNF